MKIILLGAGSSIHIQRWANSLCENGDEVFVISAHNFIDGYNFKVTTIRLTFTAPFGYLLAPFQLRKIVNGIKPDIVNAHYATGYGLLSSFIRRFPVILSIWGSDVYVFPSKSLIHKLLVKFSLSRCTSIASTSKDMRLVVRKLVTGNQELYLTPFGIDTDLFKKNAHSKKTIVVGTTKGFGYTYGTDILIQTFAEILKYSNVNVKLLIIGGGHRTQYVSLAERLGIIDYIEFRERVVHSNLVHHLNEIDIFVALSRSESFGVSVLEASSCEIPVITSNVGGLPEVVDNGETGYVVDLLNTTDLAQKIYELITDEGKRLGMGRKGREFVKEFYSWNDSVVIMRKAYTKTLRDFRSQGSK